MADGVQQVESGTEGALQRLTIQVLSTSAVKAALIAVVGESNVETLVEREPNLEEAYLSILK